MKSDSFHNLYTENSNFIYLSRFPTKRTEIYVLLELSGFQLSFNFVSGPKNSWRFPGNQ